MNNKNGLLISLIAFSLIWAMTWKDPKNSFQDALYHVNEYGVRVALGPPNADAGTIGNINNMTTDGNGYPIVSLSGSLNISNLTVNQSPTASIIDTNINGAARVSGGALTVRGNTSDPVYSSQTSGGSYTVLCTNCATGVITGTITQGQNGTVPWATTTWQNGTYVNSNNPFAVTVTNQPTVNATFAGTIGTVSQGSSGTLPWAVTTWSNGTYSGTSTNPFSVNQGQTTATSDSVKSYTADGTGNAVTSDVIGTRTMIDVYCSGCSAASSVSISNSPTVYIGNSISATVTGGANFTDNTPFTAGTTTGVIGMGVYNDSLTTITSGSAAAKRITPYRAVHTNPRDNSGNELFTSSNPGNEKNVNGVGSPVNTVLTLNNTTNAGSSTNPLSTNSTINNALGSPANVVITANNTTNVFASTNPGYVQTVSGIYTTVQAVGATITANANTLFGTSVAAAWTVPSSALVTYAQSFSGSTTNVILLCSTNTCDSTHATLGVLTQYQQRKLDYLKPGTTIWAATNGANASAIFWSVAP